MFRSGIVDRLYPAHCDDGHRLYADRGAARRLCRAFGTTPAAAITEDDLCRHAREGAGKASTRSRDAGLLRAALQALHQATGRPSPLLPRARPRPGRKTPPPLAPQPEAIIATLRAADQDMQVAVALALGAGATPAEILEVRARDVVAGHGDRPYVLLGSGRRKRPIALPDWADALVLDARRQARSIDLSARLIANKADAAALQRALAAAVRRAGQESGAVTLRRLTAAHRALIGRQGAPRGVVRGRWAVPPVCHGRRAKDWPEACRLLYAPGLALARTWPILSQPEGGWPERVLPRPSGRVRAHQPERRPGAGPASLPPSVR